MVLTVDIVLTLNNEKVVLIERTKEPFMDKLVFPGGHVEEIDNRIIDACVREADEEICFKTKAEDLKLLTILDKPGGDPRNGKRASVVYHINVTDEKIIEKLAPETDAKAIHLVNIKDLKKEDLGFDHWDAIKLLK